MNRTKTVWLLTCHNYHLLAKALSLCVQDPALAQIHCLISTEEPGAENLAEMMQLAFVEACFQAGLFAKDQSLPGFVNQVDTIKNLLKVLPPIPPPGHVLYLVPESLSVSQSNTQELDVEVSVQQSIFLEDLDSTWEIDEAFLLALESTPSTLSLRRRESYFGDVRICVQQILALPPDQDPLQVGRLSERIASIEALQLMPFGLANKFRGEIQTAILRLHNFAHDLPALAVLALFHRDYVVPGHPPDAKCIHVYPPIADWRVTVVMVTYNRLHYLQRAVNAVLNQTSPRWKLLIMDHGCQDGSTEWLQTLAEQFPAKITLLRQEENQGPEALGPLYQQLLEEVDTELVLIQSDDDWLYPHHLERVLNFWQRHPWLGMVATSYQLLSPTGELVYQYGPFYPMDCIADPRLENLRAALMRICPQAAVFRKTILKQLCSADTLFFRPQSQYAIWDLAITALTSAQSETGMLEEVLSAFTVSEQTTFFGYNFVWHQVMLLKRLIILYNQLWGQASFPRALAQKTLDTQLNLAVQHFLMALQKAPHVQCLPEILTREQMTWKQIIDLRQELEGLTSIRADSSLEVTV